LRVLEEGLEAFGSVAQAMQPNQGKEWFLGGQQDGLVVLAWNHFGQPLHANIIWSSGKCR